MWRFCDCLKRLNYFYRFNLCWYGPSMETYLEEDEVEEVKNVWIAMYITLLKSDGLSLETNLGHV